MISPSRYAILIVTHNHQEYIGALLHSLNKQRYENIYICDAASDDGSLDLLNDSDFHILPKSTVEGFARNNNDLIRGFNIDVDYIILLNPDTYFQDDIAKELVNFMDDHPKAAIAAPQLQFPNGHTQISWKKFPNLISVIAKRLGRTGDTQAYDNRTQKIDWAIGAALIVRSNHMLEHAKLLDERYRLYCEDSDLCFSAHEKGHEVWGIEEIVVYHHLHEKSAARVISYHNWLNIQSLVKFILKWNFRYMRYLVGLKR